MNKWFLKILSVFIFVVFCKFSVAQINHANIIGTSEGLPSSKVRALQIDFNGRLWIGTENGLVTYKEGMTKPQLVHDSIPFYNCWSITQDADGGMWFAGYGEGVAYKKNETWKTYTIQNGLISNNTRKLFCDQHKVYVGSDKGVMAIDLKTDEISVFVDSLWQSIDPHVLDFFSYKNEVYAVTYKQGIYRLNQFNLSIEKVNDITPIDGVHTFRDSIIINNENITYTGSTKGVVSGISIEKRNAVSSYWAFDTTSFGVVYAAAWGRTEGTGGVYKMDSGKWVSCDKNWDITTNDFRDIVIDKKTNTLFAASMTKGVYSVDLNETIIHYPSETVQQVLATPYGEWILHNSYLELKTKNNITLKFTESQFISESEKGKARKTFGWENNPKFYELGDSKNNKELNLYQIRKSNSGIWINTSRGMFEINTKGVFVSYLPTHNFVFDVDDSNRIVEAIPYGGARFLKAEKQQGFYDLTENNVPDNVLDIASFDSTVFFASIFTGLYHFNENQFFSCKKDSQLLDNKLRKLYKADKDEMWVITDFGDLYKVNLANGFQVFDTINVTELYGSVILDALKYNDYSIILTNEGLNIYHPHKGNRLIDQDQGLKGDLYSLNILNDFVYLSGFSGYYSINLIQLLHENVANKTVEVTELLVNNEKWNFKNKENLKLNYDQNALELFFTHQGFKYPNKLRFQYRLRPDQNWSSPTKYRFVLLPYLESGNYEIGIRVLDANEGMVYETTILKIRILESIYKSWWFYTIISILLLGIGYIYLMRRTNRLIREEQRIAQANFELDKSKMQGLLSRMNPHFLFNALNSIQSFVLSNETDRAIRYIGKFAYLMRATLNLSQSLVIRLNDEIEYLKSYIEIENLRFENNVKCIWKIDETLDLDEIELPGMILQPLIENVFVHGFNTNSKSPKLEISIKQKKENYLKVTIKDNGIGFDSTDVKSTSQGIKLIEKRLALLEKDKPHLLNITSKLNKGTRVEVLFFIGEQEEV